MIVFNIFILNFAGTVYFNKQASNVQYGGNQLLVDVWSIGWVWNSSAGGSTVQLKLAAASQR